MRNIARLAAMGCGFLLMAAVSPAWAHHFWLTPDNHFPQAGDTVKVMIGFGHEYPASRQDQPVKEGMVAEVVAILPDGSNAPLQKTAVDAYQIKIERPGPYLLVASMPPGLFSRTPEGMKRGGKKDFAEVKDCRDMRMVANALLVAGGQGRFAASGPQPLQMKPLADMAGLKKGGLLPIQALFEGKPLPEAKIMATYAGYQPPPGAKSTLGHGAAFAVETLADASGKAELKLDAAGYWLVILAHSTPYEPADVCDKRVHAASFVFQVK